MEQQVERRPKNIVVCCDGTGNRYGDDNSNVVKLYTCLRENSEQVSYYHPGVGTMGDPRQTTWLGRKLSVIEEMAFGLGLTANMSDAYRFLMDHHADGDRIYLFGFSRGAYTVRALAGAIRLYGLLCSGNEGHLPYLMDMYSRKSREAFAGNGKKQIEKDVVSDGFRETFSRTVPIHFVGLWDTVSSVGGIYDPVKLLYDGQNSIVRKARHAVSLDERRCFFQANLLGEPLAPPYTPVLVENYPDTPEDHTQDVVQAWFAGVHSDVGGSYAQAQSAPALEALKWMLDEAAADGLEMNDEKRAAIFGAVADDNEPAERYAALREMNEPPAPFQRVHESLCGAWKLLELFPHKYFDQNGVKRWRVTPWPHRREVPAGALLHPSLLLRLKMRPDYQPPNLDLARIAPFTGDPEGEYHARVAHQLCTEGFGVYGPQPNSATPAA